MRKINVSGIHDVVYEMFLSCVVHPDSLLSGRIKQAEQNETLPVAKSVLSQIFKNIESAEQNNVPLCQDTGIAVVFVDIGQQVLLEGEFLHDAINHAVRRAYNDGYFRKSVLSPLSRINTNDNTPAVIHTSIIKGDKVIINTAPKGFGSENMSKIKMLSPSQGTEGIFEFVLDTVRTAGGNPCPPVTLGIGIGGTFEQCALNAKRALLRPLGQPSEDAQTAKLESELLQAVNKIGIGPMGMGGDTTALAVHIITSPTHLAGLPCAINFQCHSVRHERRVL